MKKRRLEITGRYQATGKGYGFLIPDDGSEDLFLPPRAEGTAWHNDLVTALPDPPVPGSPRRTAVITGVVTRSNRTVTGVLFRRGREFWLAPDNPRLPLPIQVLGRRSGLRVGDRAAVTIVSYGSRSAKPTGTIAQVFGPSGTRQANNAAILYTYGIEPEFPPEVLALAEAAARDTEVLPSEGRLDLRNEFIITIDGASAKDLDDAVSLGRDELGRTVLGVHIADVSYYVPLGSPVDREAWQRGTSVYFADQVVPMLPPVLSNGICSLDPGQDRRTLSCIMTVDESGQVVDYTIRRSVIRSARRMTYEDCNLLLAGNSPELEKKYADVLPMLREMAALAGVLKRKRKLRGSLDLETQEVVILCDDTGAPVDVHPRSSGVSESIIEEFMILANETVAWHLNQQHVPAIYRIHEKPSFDKAEALRHALAALGYSLPDADNFSLQKVLAAAEGTPQQTLIHMLVLRSLMKARYDSENLGHFGLAATHYCHFTSPIRRYPDLTVHRALVALLEGRQDKRLAAGVRETARQSSERELAAAAAERDIEKCYMAEYMQGHLGEEFDGLISGVTRYGLFVTLTNGVEGLVPVTTLPEDSYEYDEARMQLTAARAKRVFSFGMAVRVRCVGADPATGQVDFQLAFPAATE